MTRQRVHGWPVSAPLPPVLLGFGFLGFTAPVIAGHLVEASHNRDYGITTTVAALITFALGPLAACGPLALVAAVGVVTAMLLSLKPMLHQWLHALQAYELLAALKLLLISVVLLPLLPDQGYGPWQALNPYEIWWFIVLIATISFAGYFAIKLAGARYGHPPPSPWRSVQAASPTRCCKPLLTRCLIPLPHPQR